MRLVTFQLGFWPTIVVDVASRWEMDFRVKRFVSRPVWFQSVGFLGKIWVSNFYNFNYLYCQFIGGRLASRFDVKNDVFKPKTI